MSLSDDVQALRESTMDVGKLQQLILSTNPVMDDLRSKLRQVFGQIPNGTGAKLYAEQESVATELQFTLNRLASMKKTIDEKIASLTQ